ncbi:DNA polymerase III subunit delta [Natribacillus halophilus]|uniref:DNA polymerase III subunit delta n=1 Tax=Natribacillus halophilus TaxID=549003 RepID=A0A1G8JU25_9BACI|nr:DNA polymerase III subunit delta [Natribacillus halophilus]SDI34597.1 DNA polymerase III, delta subunit [Natribacillus halophilus]
MSAYLQTKKNIQSGHFSSVYFFYGTERYIVDDLIHEIKKHALAEEDRTVNFARFDMREVPVQEGLEEAETVTFFGSGRVIVLSHARFLTGARDKDMPAHDLKKLEAFLAEPSPDDIVIFTVEAEKVDERKKVVKKLKAAGETVEAAPLTGEKLQRWVTEQARGQNVTLSAEALETLLAKSPGDLLILEKEIQKCAQYVNFSGEITASDVEVLVPRSLEDNIFQLIDAVSENQTGKALQLFDDLLRTGEEPIKIIVLIGRQFRMMGMAREMSKRGYNQQKMASQLGVPPFVAKRLRAKAQSVQEEAIARALSFIAETDYKMKQGTMEKKSGVALLIARLPRVLAG